MMEIRQLKRLKNTVIAKSFIALMEFSASKILIIENPVLPQGASALCKGP
jgi:hypothetical protein